MPIETTQNEKNNCHFWTLLIFYVIYWFAFFPIIWFTIQPAAFKESTLATILYALLFFAVFILLFCIIYCCCFMCTQKRKNTKPLHRREKFTEQECVEESTDSTEAAYFLRKSRPVSKRVSIPIVPATEISEGVKYTRGDAKRDSTITIPLFIDDRNLDKKRFVTQQALYFDGSSFLGE